MKVTFGLFAALMQLGCSWGSVVPGDSVNEVSHGVITFRQSLPEDCKGVYGTRCVSCSELQVCADIEIFRKKCGAINPSTPYCTTNGCSDIPEEGCSPPFTCTGLGFLPDMTDCTRYYLCSKPGDDKPVEFKCPTGFVYDSKTELCRRKRNAQDCEIVNCAKTPATSIPHRTDKSIMIFCPDETSTPIVLRCRDSVYGEFDPQTLQCKFTCPNEGRYTDRLDCTKYYECYKNGTHYSYLHQDCGPTNKYDNETKKCVVQDAGTTCTNEVPSLEAPQNPAEQPPENNNP